MTARTFRATAACIAAAFTLAACDRAVAPPSLPSPQAPDPAASPSGDAKAPSGTPTPPAKPAPTGTAALVAPTAGAPSDAEITAGAAQALAAEPALAGANLSVTTDHGVVKLTGSVRSPEQVALAEERAQVPAGVMRVETHLEVDPG
jgi:hypothetical protein